MSFLFRNPYFLDWTRHLLAEGEGPAFERSQHGDIFAKCDSEIPLDRKTDFCEHTREERVLGRDAFTVHFLAWKVSEIVAF